MFRLCFAFIDVEDLSNISVNFTKLTELREFCAFPRFYAPMLLIHNLDSLVFIKVKSGVYLAIL